MNKQKIERAIDELGQQFKNAEDCLVNGTTIELAIHALEKQIPKKVRGISATHEGSVGNCPVCGKFIRYYENKYYCNFEECGQAIDWGNEDE